MSNVTNLAEYRAQREHFEAYEGLCPICRKTDGMLNIHRDHFMHCKTHKVWWYIGRNCYSGWLEDGPDVWEENDRLLSTFKEVQPFRPGQGDR